MADKSKIEWTDATWNPIRARHLVTGKIGWHCEHISEGCRNCYAERTNLHPRNAYTGTGLPYKPGHRADVEIILDEKVLLQPLQWRRPRMIFPCSMTDLFADFVPDRMIFRCFAIMALCPRHTFQVLTKRSERMRRLLSNDGFSGQVARACVDLVLIEKKVRIDDDWPVESIGHIDMPDDIMLAVYPLPNVWLGVSCEDQATADQRIPDLLATPATVRFVSAEPLLGPIDFESAWHGESALESECWGDCAWCKNGHPPLYNCQRGVGDWEKGKSGLDWIIVGGESGRDARPMSIQWVREIRDQCATAGVAFLFKQWGEWRPAGCHRSEEPGRFAFGDYEFDRTKMVVVDHYPRQFTQFGARSTMQRVGKKAAGRHLDGVNHDALPAAAAGRQAS